MFSLLSRPRLGGLLWKVVVFGAIFFAVTFADGLARSWNYVSGLLRVCIFYSHKVTWVSVCLGVGCLYGWVWGVCMAECGAAVWLGVGWLYGWVWGGCMAGCGVAVWLGVGRLYGWVWGGCMGGCGAAVWLGVG